MNYWESQEGLNTARQMISDSQEIKDTLADLPRNIQERIYDAVKAAVAEAMENVFSKQIVPMLETANTQRQTQIEQSSRIEKIEREQLGVQTTDVFMKAKEWGREADLGLTSEQVSHGIQSASAYFNERATAQAIREAEFERDMAELEAELK